MKIIVDSERTFLHRPETFAVLDSSGAAARWFQMNRDVLVKELFVCVDEGVQNLVKVLQNLRQSKAQAFPRKILFYKSEHESSPALPGDVLEDLQDSGMVQFSVQVPEGLQSRL